MDEHAAGRILGAVVLWALMAIYLAMVRVGACEICQEQFIINAQIPKQCPHCGTRMWLYGVYQRESTLIRQGSSFVTRTLNKGVTSAKRQAHGRKQWRQFKPKPEN